MIARPGELCSFPVQSLPRLHVGIIAGGLEARRFVRINCPTCFEPPCISRAIAAWDLRTVPQGLSIIARLNPLCPHLLEDAFLELRPRAEELLIGSGGRLVGVLEGGQFHRADVVRDLAEPVVGGRREPVCHRVLCEGVVDSLVDRPCNRLLAVVVVDLHDVKVLEVCQLVEQEVDEALPHRGGHPVKVAVLLRLERDARVAHRHVAEEHPKRREEPLPVGGLHVLVAVMAVQEWGSMKRDVGQPLLGERPLVQADAVRYVLVLLVEHEREEVVPVLQVVAPGLVYEQAELAQFPPLIQRKPGKTPPALGSPPIGEPSNLYHRMLFLATGI